MKINKTLTALIAGASLGMSGQVFAAGTTAGDTITNTVSMSYKVGATTLNATPATQDFKVDTKIDLTLTWLNGGTLVTGTAGNEVPFILQITNDGNAPQNFKFTSGQVATAVEVISGDAATADSDDWTSIWKMYADTNSNGAYNSGVDLELTNQLIPTLAVDTPTTVFVVFTAAPDDAVDGAVIGAEFKAQVSDGAGTALPQDIAAIKNDNLTANYIVYAESTNDSALTMAPATRDGARVVMIGSDIQAANVVATKSVVVKDDGLGNAQHRAIPGATVTYTIEVENTGRAPASDVNVLDTINDIVGLLDDSVVYNHATQFTYSGAGTVTNSSDLTKIDILIDNLVKSDSNTGTGDDYFKIVFDASVE